MLNMESLRGHELHFTRAILFVSKNYKLGQKIKNGQTAEN